MSERFKNCPHCGNAGNVEVTPVWYASVGDNYHVVCNWNTGGCGAMGGARRTEAEAITAWNARADDAQVIADGEKCELAGSKLPSNDNQARDQAERTESGAESARQSNDGQADSRERLEAAMWEFIERWAFDDDDERRPTTHLLCSKELHELLDRQAALDRKEFEMILEGIQECMRNGGR